MPTSQPDESKVNRHAGRPYCKACGNPDCPIASPGDAFFRRCPAEAREAKPTVRTPVLSMVELVYGNTWDCNTGVDDR